MKERPIIFSGESVRAILDGRKTMTRRVIKPQLPDEPTKEPGFRRGVRGDVVFYCGARCPYGSVTSRLWVRETWAVGENLNQSSPCTFIAWPTWFKADDAYYCIENGHHKYGFHSPNAKRGKWRPSTHMPRWASRITLEVTNIRVERLQEINKEDAVKEGVDYRKCPTYQTGEQYLDNIHCGRMITSIDYIKGFQKLWDSINEKRGYSWEKNPWVWVIEFKVVKP